MMFLCFAVYGTLADAKFLGCWLTLEVVLCKSFADAVVLFEPRVLLLHYFLYRRDVSHVDCYRTCRHMSVKMRVNTAQIKTICSTNRVSEQDIFRKEESQRK